MYVRNIIAMLLVIIITASCSQNGGRDGGIKKSDIGSVLGAVGGAWVGSNVGKGKGNIAAIAAGTLLGAYAGNQVGESLDRADMAYYNRTSNTALEKSTIGTTSTWVNPDSGNSGTITPTKTFKTASNIFCREFSQTITINGRTEEAFGTACRQPDGTWKIKQ